MYKNGFGINNLQCLICQTKPITLLDSSLPTNKKSVLSMTKLSHGQVWNNLFLARGSSW